MKKLIYFLFAILILSNSIIFAQKKIEFDVKTKFHEKSELIIAKAGLIGCLKASNWAIKVEYGEDYAIWLKNYKTSIIKDLFIFEIDVEIRKASLLKEGKLINSTHIKDTINISEVSQLSTLEDRENFEKVKKQLNKSNFMKNKGVDYISTAVIGAAAVPTMGGSLILLTAVSTIKKEVKKDATSDDMIKSLGIGLRIRFYLEEVFNIK